MTRPDFDYEAHERGIERAEQIAWERASEPDPYGWQANRAQTRWERDRGNGAVMLWVGSILVAFGALSILWPLLVWALLAACFLMATVAVVCVVVGTRKQAPEVDR